MAKILYFIADSAPTAADTARAEKIDGTVAFRNVDEDDGAVEDGDFVTSASGVTIPTQYAAVPRYSSEKPISLEIVPNNPTADLSDVEHLDLRAIARFSDGTAVDVTTQCVWGSATPGTCTIGAATGYVTPVGVGTSVITATYNWAAPGEAGTAYAQRVLTLAAVPIADETVTIGAIVYTWKAAVSTVANQVKIGADIAACCKNLADAINKSKRKSAYGSLTVEHPTVRASYSATTVTAIAKNPGTAGNAIASTETGTQSSWAGATLAGGTDATAAVADTTLVTVVA